MPPIIPPTLAEYNVLRVKLAVIEQFSIVALRIIPANAPKQLVKFAFSGLNICEKFPVIYPEMI